MVIAAILSLNFSYILIFQDRIATIFVVAALLCFLGVLVLVKRLASEHDSLPWQDLHIKLGKGQLFLFILPFFIPVVCYPFHQCIVFWRFDATARVALAWFVFSLIWLNSSKEKNIENGIKGVLAPFLLCSVWVTVLWLSLIWDVGSRAVFLKAISSEVTVKSDRLASVIYKIWETRPFSEHFGLAFLDYDAFKENAYAHHGQLYLSINYVVVKFFQTLFNCKMEVATRLIPFFFSIILTISVVFFFLKTKFIQIRKASVQVTFFLGLGFLLSLPDLWITLLRYNTDNYVPWVPYITLVLFAYICVGKSVSKMFVFILYFYCILLPFFAFFSLVTFCFYRGTIKYRLSFARNWLVFSLGAIFAVISYAYPYAVIKALRYHDVGSSFLFRSGLDGDTSYYKNIWQAVVHPYAKALIRPWSSLIPVGIFCVIAFIFGGLRKYKEGSTELMDAVFLFSPYLFCIVFFPQSVSIHPYGYDYLLLFPLAFLGLYWFCSQEFQEKIKGPWHLALSLFLIAFVIYNFTMLAQAARNLPF